MTVELTPKQREQFAQDLPAGAVKSREQGGSKVSYVDGHYVISRLNDVFGHNGWSFEVREIAEVYRGTKPGKDGDNLIIIYRCIGVLTALGCTRVDVGGGQCDAGPRALAQAIEKAMKEAATDALKRCARTFGPSFGLAMYDKTQSEVGWSFAAQECIAALDAATTPTDLDTASATVRSVWDALSDAECTAVSEASDRAVKRVGASSGEHPAGPAPAKPPPATNANATAAAPAEAASLAAYRARLAAAPSRDALVATIVELMPTIAAVRTPAWQIATARAAAVGIDAADLGTLISEAMKITSDPAAWATAAKVFTGFALATTTGAIAEVVKAHAAAAVKLPDALRARINDARTARRAALAPAAAPTDVAAQIEDELRRAGTIPELDSVADKIETAAKAGTITPEQAKALVAQHVEAVAALEGHGGAA